MSRRDFEAVAQDEVARLCAVHPTPDDIPRCLGILDEFFLCYALGSQFRSLYRSGTMADCGRKMDEFKFCLSLKSASPEDRRSEWIRRRAEWWARRRLGKSSEDVWEARSDPLPDFPPHPSKLMHDLDVPISVPLEKSN